MKKGILAVIAGSLICMQSVSFSATSSADEIASENTTLQSEITQLNTEIEDKRLEIAQIQQQIDDSDIIINDLNTEIENNKEVLKGRLLSMYLAGNASNLEVILGATSFDDFLNKVEYVSIIAENDSQLISDLTQQVNISNKARDALNNNLTTLDTEQKNLESKRDEFQLLLDSNIDALSSLYAEGAVNSLPSADVAYGDGIVSYYDKQLITDNAQSATEKPTQSSTTGSTSSGSSSSSSSSGSSSSSSSGSTVVIKPKPVTDPTQPTVDDSTTDNTVGSTGGSVSTVTGYTWPVPGFYHLTSLWDEDRGDSNHGALDIASAGVEGANVVAARAGVVDVAENNCVHNWGKDSSCGCGGGYGNWVRIDHGDGYTTIYAHMSSITVGYGDYVEAGQLLGFVGSTGYSTGAHLHYETRYNNVKYNPLDEYPNISVTY